MFWLMSGFCSMMDFEVGSWRLVLVYEFTKLPVSFRRPFLARFRLQPYEAMHSKRPGYVMFMSNTLLEYVDIILVNSTLRF